MVEYEYDNQIAAYDYMNDIEWSGKQVAINKWSEGKYTDWTMVKYEYEK